MANHQIGNLADEISFVDKRRSTAGSVAQPATTIATVNNYKDITSLRTRLTAISATAYSAKNLDTMTANDMIYALRLNDDPTGIV